MPLRADQALLELRDLCPPSVLRVGSRARLRPAFQRALQLVFASSLGVWAGACDSAELACERVENALEEIAPAQPVDYVASHQITRFNLNTDTASVLAQAGTPCSGAADVDTCRDALAATASGLELTDNCGMIGMCRKYLVTTAGDKVERYATRDELLKFLGAIDAPADALVLLDFAQLYVPCGEDSHLAETDDGYEVITRTRVNYCPGQDLEVTRLVRPDGRVQELDRELLPEDKSGTCALPGRRPEGLCSHERQDSETELGAYFASLAYFEGASVAAFEILAVELEHHGAPADLAMRARSAARDEVRHAALTAAQAYRFGARPAIPAVEARRVRSLEAIALDNATEGAVRETYAALLACHQARAAQDPAIAGLMELLAIDEITHAELALDIDAWIRPLLDVAARERVARAQAEAVEGLERDCSREPLPAERDVAGLPPAMVARKMVGVLKQQLWA